MKTECICPPDWPASHHEAKCEYARVQRREFDGMIGRLDRLLSEFLAAAKSKKA